MSDSNQEIIKNAQLISYTEEPLVKNWAFYPMYQEGQDGSILIWQIGFDENTERIITLHGKDITSKGKKGKLQTSSFIVKENKSGRSIVKQALLEARQKRALKFRKNYREKGVAKSTRLSVQLATDFSFPDAATGLTPARAKIKPAHLEIGVDCQPKIDGIRAISWADQKSGEIEILSRGGKVKPHFDLIREELTIFFSYLPSGVGLDGELWKFGWTFNQLSSVVGGKTKNPLDSQLDYFIFDVVIPEVVLKGRIKILYKAYQDYLLDGHRNKHFHILQHVIAKSYQDIRRYHDIYVKFGFEGIMLRKMVGLNPTEKQKKESYYRGKRNNNLIKYKDFKEEEGTVIGVYEGIGKDKGTAIFRLRNDQGKEFSSRPTGPYELRRKWFSEKEKLIGKRYTFRYQELTEDGIPRFPVGKAFRNYE